MAICNTEQRYMKIKPRCADHLRLFAIEAGTGVAIATDFGYSFGNRLKFLHITPEPKPISVVIAALKGRLSPSGQEILWARN